MSVGQIPLVKCVAWDIDHTLVDTRGVGRSLFAEAFQQVTGREMERQARVDGLTEPVIFRETAKLHGIETSRDDFDAFAKALAEAGVDRRAVEAKLLETVPRGGEPLLENPPYTPRASLALQGALSEALGLFHN